MSKAIRKSIVGLAIITVVVGSLGLSGIAHAKHELKKQLVQKQPTDSHLTWHQFERELGSLGNVDASITSEGILTLAGHVEDSVTKNQIESLARKVAGTVDIRNLIFTD